MKKKNDAAISLGKKELQKKLKKKSAALEQLKRELQIEASLECVRARTTAMQKSEELAETSFVLFQQFKDLGEISEQISIGIFNEDEHVMELYSTVYGSQWAEAAKVDLSEPVVMKKIHKAWKEQKKSLVIDVSGKDLREYNAYRKKLSNIEFREDRWVIHIAFFSKGVLTFSTTDPHPQETLQLLERFAGVFDQTYTRFLDLKKAEAQARESQVEAALEKVRARTMGMQRSGELAETAVLLFQQLKWLGLDLMGCGFNIWEKNEKTCTAWMSGPEGKLSPPFNLPLTEDPLFIRYYESRQKGEDFWVYKTGKEELVARYQYLHTLPVLGELLADDLKDGSALELPALVIDHAVNFSNGNLIFITYKPCPEAWDIFKRFGKVFEQTYTRFLDLQKAEAQARESQIQLALERARTQSMIMQHSNELDDTLRVFHEQVLLLGIRSAFSFLWLPDEEKGRHKFWAAWKEIPPAEQADKNSLGVFKSKAIDYPLDRNEPATAQCLVDWKSNEPVVSYHVPPEGVESYFVTWQELIAGIEQLRPAYFSDGLYYVEAFIKHGCFGVMAATDLTKDEKKILGRFAIEFEQTYTRFLDLQKAETQAREAKIEAALERVRSRSMGMQKSEELKEVIQVVYEQFVHLNIKIDHTGFVMDYKARNDYDIWIADQLGVPSHVTIPYFDCIYYNRFNEAKKKGVDFFATNLDFEEKNGFYQKIIEYVPGLPEETKEFLFSIPGLAASTVLLENIGLYIENFSGIPFTDEENNTLMRFGKVFEQTYTRFLDLQKAETQAREATKQASLDRVRGQIASMRSTEDLQRITPLIWRELTILDVPFIRCGVLIIDEAKAEAYIYLSSPDGQSLAAMNLPLQSNTLTAKSVGYWRKGLVYTEHWDKEDFIHWMQSMIEQGQVQNPETYQGAAKPPESLYLHFVPFTQGMLYVGNTRLLTNDEIDPVKSLAEAFSIAYARYEDFTKLEKAKQSIEATLTELKATQAQLIQSEKMASLGELTAGIAHEIQNPLNFVNNFSELNKELLEELNEEIEKGNYEEVKIIAKDVTGNEEKISHHGKRADAIVKGMLLHSRSSSATKEPTDINKLADEYLRLAYHGLRAKDNTFNATLKTDFDTTLGNINIIPQDIGRVLLNLYNNAFYAVTAANPLRTKHYEPTVTVSTKVVKSPSGDLGVGDLWVLISVRDNGTGIPQKVADKIFQPFFTTKPTGQGTGLGLSLSYDIIKAHGGEIKVESKDDEGATFTILLPTIN